MTVPRLVVVLDAAGCRLPVADVAECAIAGGADILQIREKGMSDEDLRAEIESIVGRLGSSEQIALNGNVKLANEYGLKLHLPEADPWPMDWTGGSVSRSIHLPFGVIEPHAAYAILGNILETESKAGLPGIGYRALRSAADQIGKPILAIGGMQVG